jgi:hypothetical protein
MFSAQWCGRTSWDEGIGGMGTRGKMNPQKRKMQNSLITIIMGIRICAIIKKDANSFWVLYAAPKAQCSE